MADNKTLIIVAVVVMMCCCCVSSSIAGGLYMQTNKKDTATEEEDETISPEDETITPVAMTTTPVAMTTTPAPQPTPLVAAKAADFIKWRNNKCLDATHSRNNGTRLQIYDCVNSPNLKFSYDPNTKQIKIDNKCIDVDNGKEENGTKIQLWDCMKDNPNQKFLMKDNAILLEENPKFALDVHAGINKNGNPIHLWTYSKDNLNQRFSY